MDVEGKPYLVKLVRPGGGGGEGGEVSFGDFDEPIDVQAPPADSVVD